MTILYSLTNKTIAAVVDTSNLSNLYCSTKNICNRKSTSTTNDVIKNQQFKSNKFKTGGIVAKVVVQQPNKSKTKSKTLGTPTPLLPSTFIKTLNGTTKERNNNVTEFLENVKTKFKKKKSKQKK